MSYEVRFTRAAKRALAEELPEKVATAAWSFIMGPLRENPRRVGKQLVEPYLAKVDSCDDTRFYRPTCTFSREFTIPISTRSINPGSAIMGGEMLRN